MSSDQFGPRNYDESSDVVPPDVERDDVTGEPVEDDGDEGKWGEQPQPDGFEQGQNRDHTPQPEPKAD